MIVFLHTHFAFSSLLGVEYNTHQLNVQIVHCTVHSVQYSVQLWSISPDIRHATVHMLQYICLHVQLFTYFSTLAQRLNCGDGKISDQFSHFKWLKSQQIVVFNLFFVLCSTALHMYEYVEHSERLIYGDNIPATVHTCIFVQCTLCMVPTPTA